MCFWHFWYGFKSNQNCNCLIQFCFLAVTYLLLVNLINFPIFPPFFDIFLYFCMKNICVNTIWLFPILFYIQSSEIFFYTCTTIACSCLWNHWLVQQIPLSQHFIWLTCLLANSMWWTHQGSMRVSYSCYDPLTPLSLKWGQNRSLMAEMWNIKVGSQLEGVM